MNEFNPVFGSARSGGSYFPVTDHMVFDSRIPDEFPQITLQTSTPEDLHRYIAIIEEFAHRFQFCLTQVGLLYRLSCLSQSMKIFEILRLLGENKAERLPIPWVQSNPQHEAFCELIADLRALEIMKQLLLGQRINGDVNNAMSRTKAILEQTTPLWLGDLEPWDLRSYYDANGLPKQFHSTREIFESHASAFAFQLLKRVSPRKMHASFREYIEKHRIGLYKSLEEIAKACEQPVHLDLDSILRLSDFALNGKFINIICIPPPHQYIDNELPYARYNAAINKLEQTREVARIVMNKTGLGIKFSTIELIETVIGVMGDIRTPITGLEITPEFEKGRQGCMNDQIKAALAWSIERYKLPGITSPEILTIGEITSSVIRFLNGIKSIPVDGKLFDPTPERLTTLCRICNYPVILYRDALEIFLCEPERDAQQIAAYGASRFRVAVCTHTLLTGDSSLLDQKSDELTKIGLPDIFAFLNVFGVSKEQII